MTVSWSVSSMTVLVVGVVIAVEWVVVVLRVAAVALVVTGVRLLDNVVGSTTVGGGGGGATAFSATTGNSLCSQLRVAFISDECTALLLVGIVGAIRSVVSRSFHDIVAAAATHTD
jgi:hypothetical protein